jgi:hypothetical protein
MISKQKKQVVGRIVVVQEDRFRLVEDVGRSYLFALHHTCGVGIEDLQRWQLSDVRVRVGYTGEPHIATGVTHRIAPVGGPAA